MRVVDEGVGRREKGCECAAVSVGEGLLARAAVGAHLGQSVADLISHVQVLHSVQQSAALQELHGQVVRVLLIRLLSTIATVSQRWCTHGSLVRAIEESIWVGGVCALAEVAFGTARAASATKPPARRMASE